MAAQMPVLLSETSAVISSGRVEMNGTLQVLILIMCINFWVLLSSIGLTSASSTWLDLLGLQWYWLSSSLDLTGSNELSIGHIWAIHLCCSLLCLSSHVHITGTAADVIHSIAWPHLLLRFDVCPGRISSLSCSSQLTGMVSGQCSELCGSLHGFMAISIVYKCCCRYLLSTIGLIHYWWPPNNGITTVST
jgi:heme/copper-type cytochrome/quinol oxidase subunit 2